MSEDQKRTRDAAAGAAVGSLGALAAASKLSKKGLPKAPMGAHGAHAPAAMLTYAGLMALGGFLGGSAGYFGGQPVRKVLGKGSGKESKTASVRYEPCLGEAFEDYYWGL